MAFNHLKIKRKKYRKALKEFQESEKPEKDFASFKTGYKRGFNDSLKWIIYIFGVNNVTELKSLGYNMDKKIKDIIRDKEMGYGRSKNKQNKNQGDEK